MEIKPTENKNVKEIDDFWDKEFENIVHESKIDDYDRLLSEIFGCSENEINIDFDITDDAKSALDKFNDTRWKRLSDREKLSELNEFVGIVGMDLGMKSIPTVVIDNELNDAYGYYDSQIGKIVISGKYLDNAPETVNTVAHELRHAYQHMRADICETYEDALYRVNFENYIEPIPLSSGGWLFYFDYYNQYVEVDARA